jgi:DNA modification methylase
VNKIICGDCLEVMKELPDKCIDIDTDTEVDRDRNRDRDCKEKEGENSLSLKERREIMGNDIFDAPK